ncbi:hypothetical protein AB4039_41680 [Streptomyces sp. M-16]|uniref:hypothetical protein n=1 Tax=Streptomyces sp. M-16 TaxID=3233040 RepID=UPI003F9BC6A8
MITAFSGRVPHASPAPEACGTGAAARTGRKDVRAAEQTARTAFKARFDSAYRQYAAVRLGDDDAGDVVEAVWKQIELGWAGLLRCPSPAGGAWTLLSRAVHASPARPPSPLDKLPRPAADAFLLRHCVGLEADRAAEAMGMEPAAFESLYRSVVPRPGSGNPPGIFDR